MTIRRVLVVVSGILLALLLSAGAQVFTCGPYETLVDCNKHMSLAQETMARRCARPPKTMQAIQQARAKSWATYPNKPEADKAREEFGG